MKRSGWCVIKNDSPVAYHIFAVSVEELWRNMFPFSSPMRVAEQRDAWQKNGFLPVYLTIEERENAGAK